MTPREDPASLRSTPSAIEAWWARRGGARSAAARVRPRVVEAARALSDLFTTGRPESFPDYGADSDALAAHGLWFFPRTWCQVRFPLAEAHERQGWRSSGSPGKAPPPALRVLDVGSGSGAAGLSAAWWLLAKRLASAVRIVAVDRSDEALRALRRLAAEVPPPAGSIEVDARGGDLLSLASVLRADETFDLVTCAHAMNEAFADAADEEAATWLGGVASRTTSDGLVLVVEPALRATSLRLRARAARASESGGFRPWAPEVAGVPWTPREQGRFWPHEVRRWRAPPRARALERALRRPPCDLSFSFALLARRAPAETERTPNVFRLTSPIAPAKGRFLFTGLGGDGFEHHYDLLRRDTAAEDGTRWRRVERGDVLRADSLVPSGGERSWRVPRASELKVLWHPLDESPDVPPSHRP